MTVGGGGLGALKGKAWCVGGTLLYLRVPGECTRKTVMSLSVFRKWNILEKEAL